MTWTIRIPVRDQDEPITAKGISELASHLQDEDDRAVFHELGVMFLLADSPLVKTFADLAFAVESLEPHERRWALDKLRRKAGLEDTATVNAENWRQISIPDHRPVELIVKPGGALVSSLDIEDGNAREQARATSRAAQSEAQLAERAVEAEARREHRQAREEQVRRELPPGVPG